MPTPPEGWCRSPDITDRDNWPKNPLETHSVHTNRKLLFTLIQPAPRAERMPSLYAP
jgi:hypothetical protein